MLEEIKNSLSQIFKKHEVPTDNLPSLRGKLTESTAEAAPQETQPTPQPSPTPEDIFPEAKPVAGAPEEVKEETSLSSMLNKPAQLDFTKFNQLQDQFTNSIKNQKDKAASRDVLGMLTNARADATKQAQQSPQYQAYADTLKEIKQQVLDNKQQGLDAENKAGWMQALETIGQALTQYAAARYGAEHNVNLAGLKMEKTDWDKMLERTHNRLRQELENLNDFRKETSKGQQQLLAEAQGIAEQGVKAGLEAEKEAGRLELEGLKEQMGAEKDKQQLTLAQQREANDLQYKQLLASKKESGVDSTAFKGMQKLANKEAETEKKALAQQEKALGILAGLAGKYDISEKKKDKAAVIKSVSEQLAAQGLDPDVIQKASGWFGSTTLDTPELLNQIKNQQQIIKNKHQVIQQYQEDVATAGSIGEIQSSRNKFLGQPSAEGAKPSVSSAGQTQPSSGKIKVMVDLGDGNKREALVNPNEFDASYMTKIGQ